MGSKELLPAELERLVKSTYRFFKGPNTEFRKQLAEQAIYTLIDDCDGDTKRIFQEIASGKGKPSTHESGHQDNAELKTRIFHSTHRKYIKRRIR